MFCLFLTLTGLLRFESVGYMLVSFLLDKRFTRKSDSSSIPLVNLDSSSHNSQGLAVSCRIKCV